MRWLANVISPSPSASTGDVVESFRLRLHDKSRAPKGNSFRMSARPHRGSGSPQLFRDVGERGIRDDALPKSLVFVCSPCLPVVYSSRCDISGHVRFRALDAAGLSFFASALEARLPLIGSSISFCPAAALRGFLPFAGSALRSFAMLRFRASIRSTTFSPAFAAMGLPLHF